MAKQQTVLKKSCTCDNSTGLQ